MAHQLFITDGTTTIDLTTGDYVLVDWTPQSAQLNFNAQSISDLDSYENVSESISIRIHDAASKATIQTRIRDIEKLFMTAQTRIINGFGPKVYLQVILDGIASETWQSEIVGGNVAVADGTLTEWSTLGTNIILDIERKYYWELDTDQALSITNYVPTTATAVSIWNDHDKNFFKFSGIAGSLPTPMKIQIKNNGSALDGGQRIYISNNVFNDPDAFDPYLTDADLDKGTAADSWGSSTHDSPNPRWGWDIGASVLADCAGGYFRILAAYSSMAPDFYLKASLYTTIGGTLYVRTIEGDEVYVGDAVGSGYELIDLGALPIPAGDLVSASSVGVGITARDSASGNATIEFVQIMSVTSYRKLKRTGYSIATGGIICTDNGIDGTVYAGSDSARENIILEYNKPIYAWPGRTNKVSILFDLGTNFLVNHETEIRAWVRPRRLTL